MNLKKTRFRLWQSMAGAETSQASSPGKAVRALALNEAISRLWQAQGTHSKADFHADVVPLYTALLEQIKRHTTAEVAEQCVIDLLEATAAACRHRWTLRLPLRRPGSDYRKYEIIYTHALVTAMAVGCLQKYAGTDSVEDLARQLLRQEGMARLRADPIVWEDWLGYFEQSQIGGLYAVSVRGKIHPRCAGENPVGEGASEGDSPGQKTPEFEPPQMAREARAGGAAKRQQPPPLGSGRAMLAAIREAIKDGSLSVNQPRDAIQVDRQGRTFLEYPAILEWCIERLALDDDLKRVKNRFDRLKVYKRTADGKQLFRGKLRARGPRARGYVLEDPAVLWPETPPAGRFVIENLTALE